MATTLTKSDLTAIQALIDRVMVGSGYTNTVSSVTETRAGILVLIDQEPKRGRLLRSQQRVVFFARRRDGSLELSSSIMVG